MLSLEIKYIVMQYGTLLGIHRKLILKMQGIYRKLINSFSVLISMELSTNQPERIF